MHTKSNKLDAGRYSNKSSRKQRLKRGLVKKCEYEKQEE